LIWMNYFTITLINVQYRRSVLAVIYLRNIDEIVCRSMFGT
jgi:hypothetical protein